MALESVLVKFAGACLFIYGLAFGLVTFYVLGPDANPYFMLHGLIAALLGGVLFVFNLPLEAKPVLAKKSKKR